MHTRKRLLALSMRAFFAFVAIFNRANSPWLVRLRVYLLSLMVIAVFLFSSPVLAHPEPYRLAAHREAHCKPMVYPVAAMLYGFQLRRNVGTSCCLLGFVLRDLLGRLARSGDSNVQLIAGGLVVETSVTVINWMQATFGENSRPVFEFFSLWGGPWGWILVIPLVFSLAGSKAGLRAAFAITVAMTLNTYLKWCIAEPRPFYVSDQVQAMHALGGFGMPSGHAQGVATLWFTLAYTIRKSWCVWLAIIFIAITGFSRIYFGVHSPQQVAVGWALGLTTAIVAIRLEPYVIHWLQAKSFAFRVSYVVGVVVAIGLIGCVIAYGVRGEFEAPIEWLTRWQST